MARKNNRFVPYVSAVVVASVAGLLLTTVFFSASPRAQKVGGHDYVGADSCKNCHQAEYAKWRAGPHQRALSSLSEKEQNDARCRTCHTMVVSDAQEKLSGVQCETCHGPGRYYAKEYVMRDPVLRERLFMTKPTQETCNRCHTENAPTLSTFDFESALKRIKHWPDKAPAAPEAK